MGSVQSFGRSGRVRTTLWPRADHNVAAGIPRGG